MKKYIHFSSQSRIELMILSALYCAMYFFQDFLIPEGVVIFFLSSIEQLFSLQSSYPRNIITNALLSIVILILNESEGNAG